MTTTTKRAAREKERSRVQRLNRKVPELMGAKEVAALLNVDTSNLDRVGGLPPAAQELERGRVWRADVIKEFAKKRRRAAADGSRAKEITLRKTKK